MTATFGLDPDAFESFYREHLPAIRGFVARRASDPQHAADLTADVFISAIERSGSYDPRRGPLIAWLLGVARHVVADDGRRRARQLRVASRVQGRALLDADSTATIAERIDAERDAARALAAMADLPGDERAILELVAVDGLSVTDAASALGVKPGTARVRLHRARRRIAEHWPGVPDPIRSLPQETRA